MATVHPDASPAGAVPVAAGELFGHMATQAVWVELELTLVHFGWIWRILQVVAALTGQLAHRVETWLGAHGTIQVIGVTALAGITVLAIGQLVGLWLAPGCCLLREGFCRAFYGRFESAH